MIKCIAGCGHCVGYSDGWGFGLIIGYFFGDGCGCGGHECGYGYSDGEGYGCGYGNGVGNGFSYDYIIEVSFKAWMFVWSRGDNLDEIVLNAGVIWHD